MAYESNSLVEVAFKVQSALGSPASGAGATLFRPSGGAGLNLTKALIQSGELRADGQQTRGRHGSRQAPGTYEAELSLGTMDAIVEAVMRGTFDAALTIDESDFTSLTTGANSIILGSGSPIALGLRVGDVIRLANFASAGNNSRNLRVTGLDATTITVAETLTVNGTPDTACSITRPGRKLINPPAGSLVERYFTVMEYGVDVDAEELFTDVKFGSIRLALQPDNNIAVSLTGLGRDMEVNSGGSAPTFTSPTATASVPLAVADATIRLGSSDLVAITGFELEFGIPLAVPPVLGNGGIGPDVFSGAFFAQGSMTLLRADYQATADFLAETEFAMQLLLAENESAPEDFISLFLPSLTLGGSNKSALSRQAGGRTVTVPLVIGAKPTTSGWDASTVVFQGSNAS